MVRWLAAALASLGTLIAGSADAFRNGVEATIFDNFDQVLGCSPSPCHRPIDEAFVSFPDAPPAVAQGEFVNLTLRVAGGPGATCGFTADASEGEFSVVQPDPLVRFFGNVSTGGLTHSAPRPFDASVCEFILRWEATVPGESRIAVNGISANGDFMRVGDAYGFEEIAIAVAPLVYQITPYDIGGGFSIDAGWIGTVSTAPDDGLLSSAEILSFSVSYTHPSGQDTLTDADATVQVTGNIAISATQIQVLDESPADHFNQIVLDDDSPFAFLRWRSIADEFGDFQPITAQEPAGLAVSSLQLPPGSIEVAHVPEPSLPAMQQISVLWLVGLARLRRKANARRFRGVRLQDQTLSRPVDTL